MTVLNMRVYIYIFIYIYGIEQWSFLTLICVVSIIHYSTVTVYIGVPIVSSACEKGQQWQMGIDVCGPT
jgi:hypothetical protein